MYVIYLCYIYETYALESIVTDQSHLQLATMVISKTSLQGTTDICSNMSQCNRYSVTYCVFLPTFIVSCNQH